MQGELGGTSASHFDPTIFRNVEPPFDEPAHGLRIDAMLLGQNTAGETLLVIPRQHRHDRLDHDRPIIEFGCHKMYARPMQPHPGFERAPVRMQTRESGQQRRMDIEQASRVMPHELLAEHSHESCQHDQIRRVSVDGGPQGGIELGPFGIIGMRNDHGFDAPMRRKRKPGGIGAITDDRCNTRTGNIRPDDGFHITATAGNKNDNGFHDAQKKNSRAAEGPRGDSNSWGDIPGSNR